MGTLTMGGISRITDVIDSWLGRFCQAIIFASMIALLAVIGANVVARYLFAAGGINEVGEIPELIFPWLIAAGIILGVQRGAHISVDFITPVLGPKGKIAMIAFINAVVIASYGALIGPVLEIAQITSIETTPLLRLPRSIGFYSLAFAMLGVMFASLAVTLRVIAHGHEAAPEFNPEESVT
jgi:TRAP-type transport system small permease protein